MPYIAAATAPVFRLDGVVFTGLAAPSRGARETSVWRVSLEPNSPGAEHSLDRGLETRRHLEQVGDGADHARHR